MTDEFSVLCLQASIALLIALLAWGNQIRQPRREVATIEQKFLTKLGKKLREVAPIIHDAHNTQGGTQRYTFSEEFKAIVGLLDARQLGASNVDTIEGLKRVDSTRRRLENQYDRRYFLTIALTIQFGLSGLLSFYYGIATILTVRQLSVSLIDVLALGLAGVILVIISNLVSGYLLENRLLKQLQVVGESMDVD